MIFYIFLWAYSSPISLLCFVFLCVIASVLLLVNFRIISFVVIVVVTLLISFLVMPVITGVLSYIMVAFACVVSLFYLLKYLISSGILLHGLLLML